MTLQYMKHALSYIDDSRGNTATHAQETPSHT